MRKIEVGSQFIDTRCSSLVWEVTQIMENVITWGIEFHLTANDGSNWEVSEDLMKLYLEDNLVKRIDSRFRSLDADWVNL